MEVSVIIPCYNQGRYLKDAVDSVLMQTYKFWECIIIDDGSTDETKIVALSYHKKDSRVKYIYQETQGVCAARNNAIRVSNGKYILCLDADDKISNTYFEYAVRALDCNPNVVLVTTHYQYFGKSKKKVWLEPYSIEKLMGHNLFINCSMFRKVDFERVKGFNPNMKLGLEDWDFWLSLLEGGGSVKYVDGINFFYRKKRRFESRNDSSASKNLDYLRKQIWLNHLNLYASVYLPPKETVEYVQISSSLEYRLGRLLLKPLRYIKRLLY
ncbi:glycosyltransferase family 2 protein [Bacteroidales bacterium SW292]|nr:glycosyltransferase family 2 protein [Bacteroidales bacterium SW292]